MTTPPITRRAAITGALALGGCGSGRGEPPVGPLSPLRSVSPVPVGSCVNVADLSDPALVALLLRNVTQLTPGWELKMSAVVGRDGAFHYAAADRLADFATGHGLRLHGHTLVWYKHVPEAFARLAPDRTAFSRLYGDYIAQTVRRYRGRASGWDVLNEPVNHDGIGVRDSTWSQVLGQEEHMLLAFAHAAEADPATPLFINEYGLEVPTKRATFMRLVERLLKRGARIDGIGTQTHINIDLPEGASAAAIRDLARFGLPIHVSELDVSLGRRRTDLRSTANKLAVQARRTEEVATAFLALPSRQRHALTLWGLRDRDSWLRQPPYSELGTDRPLPFDDEGAPKPMARALVMAMKAARGG